MSIGSTQTHDAEEYLLKVKDRRPCMMSKSEGEETG